MIFYVMKMTIFVLALAACATNVSSITAQEVRYVYGYDPVVIISRSITAQGDLIRAQGEAYRNYQAGNLYYARARKELAEAVDKELDNWLKHVTVYWDRRLERENKRMELLDAYERRKDGYLERRKAGQARLLKSILTDRERTRLSIESGRSLNKLLDAFAKTPVSFGVDLSPSIQQALGDSMQLSPSLLDGLHVSSTGAGNKTVFRLTQSTGMDLSWWPDLLRRPAYEKHREAISEALTSVTDQSSVGGQVDPLLLDALGQRLGELAQEYYRAYPQELKREMKTHEMTQYLKGDSFLIRLHRDLQRMRDTGNALAMGNASPFQPDVDGKDVPSLIRWMLNSGVKFSKPTPGNEVFYQQIFGKMSTLYSAVAES